MATSSTKQPYEIALVLAGAVACGSYLAGFLDQFLDALDEWEEKKKNNDPYVPSHQIKIKVISGSSAGGMSAAIFLREAFRRAELRKQNPEIKDLSKTSLLRKAWVESIDIKDLLGSRDLIGKDDVESLLDCSKIDEVANEILGKDKKFPKWIDIPYFPEDIKLYLTLTNLKGLSYKLKFTSDTNSGHQYINHADYEYFNFSENSSKEENKWNSLWEKLKVRAIATGAFPIALKPREIKGRCFDFYKNRLKEEGRGLEKHLDVNEEGDYSFYAIDGGTINNEPFDLAKSVWAVKDKDGNLVKKGELVPGQSCVLMVDPFPGEGIMEESPKKSWFYSFIPALISTLLNQSRFRADELTVWSADEVGTRFLVMPRKEENGIVSTKPLKGGFLGGVGGFFSEKFRKHDYELGKANCQSFLENYFSLPVGIASKGGILTDSKSITIKGNKAENQVVPIIPFKRKDVKPEKSSTLENQKDGEVKLTENEFTEIENQLDSRLRAVLSRAPIPFTFLFHPLSLIVPLLYIGLYLFNVGFDCINLHMAGEFVNVLILLVILTVFIGAVIYRVIPGLILKKLSDGLRKSMEDWSVLNPSKPN
ncbi:MAG: patatin-like phospholipase family protein [Algoriphagus sp.]|jgi:predicted acylesterase/phospholipase RssA|nr:patatin-like phospholipase family protein [Algoriphagus sp.]